MLADDDIRLVESDSSVLNPDKLYITNSNHIEHIQKYFTKRLFANSSIPKCSYTDRLLNIKSLSLRRLVTDLELTYKTLNGFVDVDPNKIFEVYSNIYRGPYFVNRVYSIDEVIQVCIRSAYDLPYLLCRPIISRYIY